MVNDSSDAWLMSEKWKARKIPLYYVLDHHTPMPSYELGEFVRLHDDFETRKVDQTTVAAIPNSKIDKGAPILQDQGGCL